MKRYNIALSLFVMLGGMSVLTGCADSLDSDKYFDDRRTIESVFTDINQTNNWLTQAFSFLKGELADVTTKEINGAGLHCFADDMYFGDRDSSISGDWASRIPTLHLRGVTMMRILAAAIGPRLTRAYIRLRYSSRISISIIS